MASDRQAGEERPTSKGYSHDCRASRPGKKTERKKKKKNGKNTEKFKKNFDGGENTCIES